MNQSIGKCSAAQRAVPTIYTIDIHDKERKVTFRWCPTHEGLFKKIPDGFRKFVENCSEILNLDPLPLSPHGCCI
jgi:hypothetical protein